MRAVLNPRITRIREETILLEIPNLVFQHRTPTSTAFRTLRQITELGDETTNTAHTRSMGQPSCRGGRLSYVPIGSTPANSQATNALNLPNHGCVQRTTQADVQIRKVRVGRRVADTSTERPGDPILHVGDLEAGQFLCVMREA